MPDFPPEDDARLVAALRAGDNAQPLSVGELSQRLKRTVEQAFTHIRVRGEISGFKRAASGHLYFGLKDADARIDGIIWKGNAARLAFRPEDGLDVIATGKLTTYPGRSSYQIVIDALELAGEGALLALLEKTKARLAAEGLFDPERKRPLPRLPRTIGVVTSPAGAVIRDILHRLSDRFPVQVLVWPVLVQGEQAAGQVAAAIRGFNAMEGKAGVPRPDLIIVARGGGSIEDLWAFNEEIVVRAVADCRIPLISAVGHETDTTLIDFAADRRAPTPTAAAEMAVPVRAELLAALGELEGRLTRGWARQIGERRDRLRHLGARIPALDRLLSPQRQRLDDRAERLDAAMRWRLTTARSALDKVAAPLRPLLLERRIADARQRLEAIWRLAMSLDPRALLARGYALVSDEKGVILTSAATARHAGRLNLAFADGDVAVDVAGSGGSAPSASPRRKPSAGPQPGLFD